MILVYLFFFGFLDGIKGKCIKQTNGYTILKDVITSGRIRKNKVNRCC